MQYKVTLEFQADDDGQAQVITDTARHAVRDFVGCRATLNREAATVSASREWEMSTNAEEAESRAAFKAQAQAWAAASS